MCLMCMLWQILTCLSVAATTRKTRECLCFPCFPLSPPHALPQVALLCCCHPDEYLLPQVVWNGVRGVLFACAGFSHSA